MNSLSHHSVDSSGLTKRPVGLKRGNFLWCIEFDKGMRTGEAISPYRWNIPESLGLALFISNVSILIMRSSWPCQTFQVLSPWPKA